MPRKVDGRKGHEPSQWIKDNKERKRNRLELEKKIIEERGFKSILELQRILESEYDVHVTRPTLYRDINTIGGIDLREYESIGTKILAGMKSNLVVLGHIIDKTNDEKVKIQAIKAYNRASMEIEEMAYKLQTRSSFNEIDGKPQKKKDEDVYTIRFNDNIEVVGDDEEE